VGTSRTATSGRMLGNNNGREQQDNCRLQAGEPHKVPPRKQRRNGHVADDWSALAPQLMILRNR
jgi:hypothetical protein